MEEENRLMIEEVKEDKLIKINVTINNDREIVKCCG